MTRNVIKVRSRLIWCHLTKRLPITGSSIAERSVGVLSDSSQKRPKCGNMLLSLYCQCWTHSFPQDSTGKAVVAFHVISHGMSQSQKGHLRPFFPSVWFSLIQSHMIQSHDVSCNSQAAHMSGYSFERARRARSASVEIAPQQNALPDFSQIRPRPRLGNACLSCASSFLLMILQTFVNVLLHMF